jgi:hypothetical protein
LNPLAGFVCEYFAIGLGNANWVVPYDTTVFAVFTGAAVAFVPYGVNYPLVNSSQTFLTLPVAGNYDVAIDFKGNDIVYFAPKGVGTFDLVLLHSVKQA